MPKGIDIFERANEHLKIAVSVLQYDTEHEVGKLKDKKVLCIQQGLYPLNRGNTGYGFLRA